jgi:hypothetical protein
MGFYSSPSKICICILNFTKIRWKITELLGSKVLAETPCITEEKIGSCLFTKIILMVLLVMDGLMGF